MFAEVIIDRFLWKQRESLWLVLCMLLQRMPYGVALKLLDRYFIECVSVIFISEPL